MANLAQLEEALRRADAAGDTESAQILAGEYAKMRAETYKPEPASFGKRFAMGVAEPFVGAAQFIKKGADAVGEIPGSEMLPFGIGLAAKAIRATGSAEDYQGTVDELKSAQELGSPEGIDWGRMAGNVIGLAPTIVAGGAPTTLAGVARAGAVAGGAGGLAMPVGSGDEYGATKAAQIGVGAAAGGVAGPVAQKALQGIGAAVSRAAVALRQSPQNATTHQIQVTINQTLQDAGIDPALLPQAFMRDVNRQVTEAVRAGGSIDAPALVNRATLETVGIPGTRGQITQNPSQYSRELFLREAPGGEDLATQYRNSIQTLNQRLNDLQGAGGPVRPVEAGQQVMNVLQNADNRGNALVNALYGVARQSAGVTTPINGAGFAQNVLGRMEQQMVGDRLPATFTNVLNQLSTGQRQLDIRTGEQIMRAVNQRIGQTSDRVEQAALRTFKDGLQDAIDSAGSATGQEAAQAFRTARTAAAQRFGVHDAIPALRATVNGEVAPDNFMRNYVYNATLEDFRNLGRFVNQASPQTWQQIRGQVLGDLQRAASPSGQPDDFSQAAFNRALRSLDQSGKLEVIFSPSEIQMLRAVGRAGELVQKGPPGVSRTGLSGAAKAAGMLARVIGEVPVLGRAAGLAQAGAARGGNVLQANVAATPPPIAQVPYRNAIPPELQNRLATLAGPGAVLPLFQSGGN